ncbi:uncharacterized protein At1g76070-like [Bidens hawaiensis]|uniref:uncharacterized protein At1g76070-like n=1 Tax=Bidens hawaiensis TaxID=980011 RepID=UPI0040498C9F
MEHQKQSGKPINKILKYLPRATSSVSFQNPQIYSPVKDKKPCEKPHKSNLGIGFTVVPSSDTHLNMKSRNGSPKLVFEPTSPRVSCMGQVKCKHYRKLAAAAAAANAAKTATKTNKFSRATSFTPVTSYNKEEDKEKVTKSKKKGIKGLFSSRKKADAKDNKSKTASYLPKAPSLGNMKRFASGRDAFASFDWTTQVTPLDCAQRNYYTEDERDGSDGEEVMIPSSAPVMERNKGVCDNFVRVGGVNLEPRKEINLWKRRTMAQPKPLQLHIVAN